MFLFGVWFLFVAALSWLGELPMLHEAASKWRQPRQTKWAERNDYRQATGL